MPAPLRTPTNMTIHETKILQIKSKETWQLYREKVEVEKALKKKIVDTIDKYNFKW